MEGGDAEGEQGNPLTVQFGDVAECGAVEDGLMEVVVEFDPAVELRALLGLQKTEPDTLEDLRFSGRSGGKHPPAWTRDAKIYQPKHVPAQPPWVFSSSDEAALSAWQRPDLKSWAPRPSVCLAVTMQLKKSHRWGTDWW
jgi:hypothetical protein